MTATQPVSGSSTFSQARIPGIFDCSEFDLTHRSLVGETVRMADPLERPGAVHPADSHDLIQVQGARVNNLKDITVALPKRWHNSGETRHLCRTDGEDSLPG